MNTVPPSPEAAALARAKAEHRAGRLAAAESLYRQAVRGDDATALDAHRLLAALYARSGRATQAAQSLAAALCLKPGHPGLLNDFAMASLAAGRPRDAEAAYRDALRQRPDAADLLLAFGNFLGRLGNYAEAAERYRHVLRLAPDTLDAQINLGVMLQHQGENGAAAAALERAVALDPRSLAAHFNLGIALEQLRRIDEAIACYEKAIALDPSFIAPYNNLAAALHDVGRAAEAIETYRAALRIDPGSAPMRVNLGLVLQRQGDLAGAAAILREAVALAPADAAAHFNLGNVLRELGASDAAAGSFRQASILAPDHAEAHNNLGAVLFTEGDTAAAESCFRRAVTLKPAYAEALNNLGIVLQQRNDIRAIEWHRKALEAEPNHLDAGIGLGIALQGQGRIAEAETAFDAASRGHPDSFRARWCAVMSRLPAVYESNAEITAARERYRQGLLDLRDAWSRIGTEAVAEAAQAIGLVQPFYLPAQGQNDRELQILHGALVADIMAARYPRWRERPARQRATNRPIRVGIVSGFFRDHSNWKIPIRGWVEHIDRQDFRLFGYHTQAARDAETETAERSFDVFVQGPHPTQRWAEIIAADELDILLYPEIGMDPATLPLGALRLAPVQCASWGHPTTSGLPTIDHFLSSDLMEPPGGDAHYAENLIRLPNLSIAYAPHYFPGHGVSPDRHAARERLELPQDAVLYWCGQSLHKYLPDHDDLFVRLAREVTGARFIFIDAKRPITDIFRRRLAARFAANGLALEAHAIFLPALDPAGFATSLRAADVFLDSIGWSGCNTSLEALLHGLPIVTCAGALMRGRHSAAILQQAGITDTLAGSVAEYVEIASRLGRDAALRDSISFRLTAAKARLYDDMAPVRALEALLRDWAG